MRSQRPCAGLLAMLALASPAAAQPVGDEFQVNTYTPSRQQTGYFSGGRQMVAADAIGNFVVVWQSDGQDGSSWGVFGQRYDSEGGMLGSEFRVNTHTTGVQSVPSVAASADGNFVVVWQRGDGDSLGIFGQRYDSLGQRLGAEFQVNSFTADLQSEPSVASDASGNVVVVWGSEDQDGDLGGIFGRRYDSAGGTLGSEFQVNSLTADDQSIPAVASDAGGNFVVFWTHSDGGYGGESSVYGRRFDSAGTPQGGDFLVHSDAGLPSVASDAIGNFVVVWHRPGSSGGYEVYGRRFDGQGVPLGGPFHVNSYTSGRQQHPSVASDANGNFVVAWSGAHQDGHYSGVFGQRYDADGRPKGAEFQVNSYTTRSQADPAVGAVGPNEFVVAWTSDGQDGSGDGVFGQRFDFGGGESITVVSPNTNVKWQVGSVHNVQWTHALGLDASFLVELDRDDDGSYEEVIAAAAPAHSPTRGHFAWTVSGPPAGTARVRVSWTDDPGVSDTSDVTFQIRPPSLGATPSPLEP